MRLRYTFLIFTLMLVLLSASAYSAEDPQIHSFAIAPAADQFSVIGKNGKFVLVYNLTFEQQLVSIQKPYVRLGAAALSSDSRWIAFGDSDGSVLLYEISNLWRTRKMPSDFILNGHDREVRAVAFSPDGKMLASGAADGTLQFINCRTFLNLSNNPLFHYGTNCVVESRWLRSHPMAKCSQLEERMLLSRYGISKRSRLWRVLGSHNRDITALAFSPDSKTLAAGTSGSELVLWDVSSQKKLSSLEGHDSNVGAINALVFSPDGELLASGADDKKVLLWNTETRQRIGEYSPGSTVLAIAFTTGGQNLIVGDRSGKLKHLATTDFHISPRLEEQVQTAQQVDSEPRKRRTQSPRFQRVEKTQDNTPRVADTTVENPVKTTPVNTGDDFSSPTTGPSTTPNQEEDDNPVITFRNTDLRNERHHETSEDYFLLSIYVIDDSQTEVSVEHKFNERYENIIAPSKIVNDKYEVKLPLRYGTNEFRITAKDRWENSETQRFTIVKHQKDTEGPTIKLRRVGAQDIRSADDTITVDEEEVLIRGSVSDISGVQSLEINGEEVTVASNGTFEKKLSLNYGKNPITVKATDRQGKPAEQPFVITHQFDRTRKDFALFFATTEYSGAKDETGNWKELPSAIRDAEAVAENLRDNYGFETSVFENLTKRQLLETLYDYRNDFDGTEYAPDSQLLIFFAGHGYYDEIEQEGYLITADTDALFIDPTRESALQHAKLRKQIDAITCPRILVLLDTCFSGTFDPTFEPLPAISGLFDEMSLLKQIETMLGLQARWYLTAAGDEYVADGMTDRSPFADAFLNALNTKGGVDFLLELDEVWGAIEKSIESYKKQGVEVERREPDKGQFGNSHPTESNFLFFPKIE